MTMTEHVDAATITNPMWDDLRGHVGAGKYPWDDGPQVGGLGDYEPLERRADLVGRYAWTITSPETVAFVAEHSRGRIIDPMAGSGYWAYLLGQVGVDVLSFDETPPTTAVNNWHRPGVEHAPVGLMDAATSAGMHSDRTLLLAWPPYDTSTGHETLIAYTGARVIYIGEGWGGCCGDDDMFAAFERDWVEVASHRPVQWMGIHDFVTVYERKAEAP